MVTRVVSTFTSPSSPSAVVSAIGFTASVVLFWFISCDGCIQTGRFGLGVDSENVGTSGLTVAGVGVAWILRPDCPNTPPIDATQTNKTGRICRKRKVLTFIEFLLVSEMPIPFQKIPETSIKNCEMPIDRVLISRYYSPASANTNY